MKLASDALFDFFQEHLLWKLPWRRSMRLRPAITAEQSARMDHGGSWKI